MNNLLILTLFLFLTIHMNGLGQCPNISVYSQADVDNFAIEYSGCTEVGNLFIGSLNGASSITSLSGLSQLISVSGSLRIRNNPILSSLSGLENITSVGKHLEIWGNDILNDLTGLDNLNSVEEYLEIVGNDSLTSMAGLENLTFIGEDMDIRYNDGLLNLAGLQNLTSINGDLFLYNNVALTSVTGLDNVNYIARDLRVEKTQLINFTGLSELSCIGRNLLIGNQFYINHGNPSLTDLTGLENLTSIGGGILIEDNESLTNLMGLENLIFTQSISIENNDLLESITSLSGIDHNAITYLEINGNDNLPVCDIPSICAYLHNGGTADISYNASTCGSEAEVMADCLIANPCTVIGNDTDTLALMYDDDFSANAGYYILQTLTDTTIMPNTLLLDMSLKLHFYLLGNSCERDIEIKLTNPMGNDITLRPYTTCYGGNALFTIELSLESMFVSSNTGQDWVLRFIDLNGQNNGYEYEVTYVGLNYISTPVISTLINVLHVNNQPVLSGVYQASNQINSTGTIPDSSSVNFKAGQLIRLRRGFSAEMNADFSAEIEDCN